MRSITVPKKHNDETKLPTKNIQHLHISTGTMIRFFLIVAGIAALYIVRDVVFSLIFAIIVASALEPAVQWFKERRIPRILSVIVIYLGIAAAFFFLVYLILPLLFDELRGASFSYSVIREQLESGIERAEELPFASFLSINLEDMFKVPSVYLEKLGGGLVDFASAAFGGIFSLILIVIFSFYLVAQENGIENFLRLITPLDHEPYILDLWKRAQKKLGRWMRAQMLLGAIVGVLIFFGLTFLGVQQALIFAVLAAVFEIIPVVGPILAAVPAVAIALISSPILALSVAILYFLVQQVESQLIVPVVMRQSIGLSPLVVLLALLVGAKLGGIFGILLAVPLTAIGAELVNDWDKKKRELIPQ